MLTWIYRRRGGWVASQQSFQQSAVSWTISTWIKIIQTGKNKYNIEVMSEQVLLVFPGGSKGCEPAQIDTHTHTQPQIMQCNNLSNQWNYHFFTFCFVEKHIIACRLFRLGSSLFLYENQLNLICVLSYAIVVISPTRNYIMVSWCFLMFPQRRLPFLQSQAEAEQKKVVDQALMHQTLWAPRNRSWCVRAWPNMIKRGK